MNNFARNGLGVSGLPPVNSDDNGKVLAVSNGEWVAGEAGSSLPPVTSDDNGDVLTVVDGEWGKAAPSGGGGGDCLVVKLSVDENTGTITKDKAYSEIYSAITTENIPVFVVTGGMCFTFNEIIGVNTLSFSYVQYQTANPPKMNLFIIGISSDESVSLTGQYSYALTATT